MIPDILSGLALLAATISLIFTITEKKRNQKRNAAVMQCISRIEGQIESAQKAAQGCLDKLSELEEEGTKLREKCRDAWDRLERIDEDIRNLSQRAQVLSDSIHDLCEKVGALEKGICPDYEAAKEAAKAVDDFNSGLSAILNFDPLGEARRKRENPMRELEDA